MDTRFESTVVTVQDKTIAVVSVQRPVFHNAFNASTIIKGLLPVFEGKPVVLMTVDPDGKPAYFGRSDLVLLLESINIKDASWKEVTAAIDFSESCPMKEEVE